MYIGIYTHNYKAKRESNSKHILYIKYNILLTVPEHVFFLQEIYRRMNVVIHKIVNIIMTNCLSSMSSNEDTNRKCNNSFIILR